MGSRLSVSAESAALGVGLGVGGVLSLPPAYPAPLFSGLGVGGQNSATAAAELAGGISVGSSADDTSIIGPGGGLGVGADSEAEATETIPAGIELSSEGNPPGIVNSGGIEFGSTLSTVP